jgi:DMSO/TMAO reductase YedYZ molybdopterin-dependent catalytic subunit
VRLVGPDAARSVLRAQQRRNELVERWLFRHTAMDHARDAAAGAAFPSYHVAPAVPVWDAAADGPWALEVTGLVRRPLRLSLDDLQRLPRVSQRVNHYCVEGWNAVAEWQGVRVADLARLAGASPEARYVDFRSFDVERPGAAVDDAKRAPGSAPGGRRRRHQRSARAGRRRACRAAAGSPTSRPAATTTRAGTWRARCTRRRSSPSARTGLLSPAYGAPARLHSPVKLGYKNTKYLTRPRLPRRAQRRLLERPGLRVVRWHVRRWRDAAHLTRELTS